MDSDLYLADMERIEASTASASEKLTARTAAIMRQYARESHELVTRRIPTLDHRERYMPRYLVTFTDVAKAADGPRDNPDDPELSYPGLQDEVVVCDSLTADPADRDLYRAVGGEHNGASYSIQAVESIEELREETA